ncbi:MAG: ATP-dependent metalloprotease [Candidatus Entotheonella factor]|uniref:ATP-dependent zinc metalloprotease FtsH n=1 Tax=Entotheonella factor TaxID=1429438 RepID=W4LQ99_ENTF1|nr:MAG: ATP-dependent metalloprotease [Candidatus Entotheonella factor]
MSQFYQKLALWLVFGLILVFMWSYFSRTGQPAQKILYSDFIEGVEKGQIRTVRIQGDKVTGEYDDTGEPFTTYLLVDNELAPLLREHNVRIQVEPPEKNSYLMQFLLSWAPVLLLIGLWVFFMRQMQNGGSKALSFGKSRARLQSDQKTKATFDDVAGVDEAKVELEEIIDFLKDPQRFQMLGGKIPKGVLLMGPPGTGKTLLARAIAGEANVPFFSISGSDFVEMFVGVGASRVRDLFEQGKKHAPCIIFIDEIDAVGRHRGAGLGGGHDEREQTLNQLLVEMDGFDSNDGVILIAATNRPDVLDPALLRPGRFDRQVVVARPDVRGRHGILTVHAKDIPVAPDVDLEVLARGTPGFSGADLSNLVNEAALFAARNHKSHVDMYDLEYAKDKVMMGVERRSMVISDKEKEVTAYHEAGHTLVAKMLPGTDPIHKVTIIPRGMALGVTQQLPTEEMHAYRREYLINNLAIYMGGRASEELIFKDPTTGAGNDIERATDLARKMVCEWGMSERMGPLAFGKQEEQIFLGREIAQHKDYSEVTAIAIDEEVKGLVSGGYETAKSILSSNIHVLHALAQALIEQEELSAEEIHQLVNEAGELNRNGNGTDHRPSIDSEVV